MPPAGLNVGVATLSMMVYVADATSLSVMSALKALALIVVVERTSMGLVYGVDEFVGVEPSVVYLIVAPLVVQLIVTVWGEE